MEEFPKLLGSSENSGRLKRLWWVVFLRVLKMPGALYCWFGNQWLDSGQWGSSMSLEINRNFWTQTGDQRTLHGQESHGQDWLWGVYKTSNPSPAQEGETCSYQEGWRLEWIQEDGCVRFSSCPQIDMNDAFQPQLRQVIVIDRHAHFHISGDFVHIGRGGSIFLGS